MKFIFFILVLCVPVLICRGQYFQFSQYNFSPLRVNPALAASSNYATASLLSRKQSTGGGFSINSNLLNLTYPILNYKGIRASGIGISLMDDRAGASGIFRSQEVSLSYAVSIPLSRLEFLSFGVKGLHARRKIDLDALYTGSQFVEGHGFDASLPQRELSGEFESVFNTLSLGLHWQRNDKKGHRKIYLGFSFFDLNRPQDSFFEQTNPYLATITGYTGAKVYEKRNWSILPEVILTRNAGVNVLSAGAIYRYELKRYRNRESDRLEFLTKATMGGTAIGGIQFYKGNLAMGISYDFPFVRGNVANTGAFEVGVEIRELAKTNSRLRRNRKFRKRASKKVTPTEVVKGQILKQDNPDTTQVVITRDSIVDNRMSMSTRLKEKQDSLLARGAAGELEHEPLVLEETTLKVGFDFNSKALNESVKVYLDELAAAFEDNPDLQVLLTGHTDNIGSAKFNRKLSFDRAASLRDYLVEKGVEPERITIDGKGMDEPLNDNSTPAKRSENRRVEVSIFY